MRRSLLEEVAADGRLDSERWEAILVWTRIGILLLVLTAPSVAIAGTRFVSPDGQDSNPGTSSAPWGTLRHALSATPCGDTLIVADGTYFERTWLNKECSSSAPLTVRAATPRAATLEGGVPEFRRASNREWEEVDPLRHEYRSTKTYAFSSPIVWGYFQVGAEWYKLLPYKRLSDLRSTNEYADGESVYCGPGAFFDTETGRIHVRIENARLADQSGVPTPGTLDPREIEMRIAGDGAFFAITGSHIVFDGINFRGGNSLRIGPGSHHLTFRNLEIQGGQYHVVMRGGSSTHDIVFDAIEINNAIPEYVYWTDVKSNTKPLSALQGSLIHSDGAERVTIGNSTFTRGWDLTASGSPIAHWTIRNNTWHGLIDDYLQVSSESHHLFVYGNRFLRATSFWGVIGKGPTEPSSYNTRYFYLNYVDSDWASPWCRPRTAGDPCERLTHIANTYLTYGSESRLKSTAGTFTKRPFYAQHGGSDYRAGWKIYHNTFISGENSKRTRGNPIGNKDQINWWENEVTSYFNNVIVQTDDAHILTSLPTAGGNVQIDGNVYWAPQRSSQTPLYRDIDGKSFPSLDAFLASEAHESSRASYPPGWDSNSVESDPRLDGHGCPGSGSPAASGALPLDPASYPGVRGIQFRGAVDPESCTIADGGGEDGAVGVEDVIDPPRVIGITY